MENLIDGQIFMGAGEQTLAQMGLLYQKLNRAFEILNGIQQPPRPCDPVQGDWEAEVEEGQEDVWRVASDIFFALTGEKVRRRRVE